VKAKIKKLLKDRVDKLNQILQVIHEEHPEGVPTTQQLSNFLARARNELFGSCTISFGQLQAWAESNMAVLEDEDEPFVCGWEGDFEQSEDERFFRFAVPSKRLVKIYSTSQNFHADATYKNVWQGFPVLIMTDRNRAIHPVVFAVTTNETAQDYGFVFKSLNTAVKDITSVEMEPPNLIGDSAAAITNGYTEAFCVEPPRRVN
jgi:hypothetical protein